MGLRYGMVHGRFQPFHNDHLDYVRKGLNRCCHLIIGITNPDPWEVQEELSSSHRHLKESNPFTFFQRMSMIRAALSEEGVCLEKFSFVPFPIHNPNKWPFYLPEPESVTLFLRVFSDWEQSKADRLRDHGWTVEILDAGAPKGIEATEVRQRITDGGDWRALVPKSVASIIEDILVQSPL